MRRKSGAVSRGQRQVGYVGQDAVGVERAQRGGFGFDTRFPVAVETPIRFGTRLQVDAQSVLLNHAQVDFRRLDRDATAEAFDQLMARRSRAERDFPVRHATAQRVDDRRRLPDVAESVGGDRNDQVSVRCAPAQSTTGH